MKRGLGLGVLRAGYVGHTRDGARRGARGWCKSRGLEVVRCDVRREGKGRGKQGGEPGARGRIITILFIGFNIKWGYNEVLIKEKDWWKVAFITNKGLFKLTVMFFRLTNSLATFQTMINTIFQDLIDKENVTIYMGNIVIHTGPKEGETHE